MSVKNEELLLKAKAKAMVKHFKKAAAHHEGHADDDEKCQKAHEAHAEHHEKRMGKAEDAEHDYHKASASFHKSMAKFAEKMGKREKEYAAHNKAMGAACEDDDAKKIYQSLEIEEEEPVSENVNKNSTTDPKAAPSTPAQVDPAAATPPVVASAAIGDLNETITKAIESKLTIGVDAALERVLGSDEFNKKMDNVIAGKLLEKLGSTTVQTEVKTFAVPRGGDSPANTSTQSKSAINYDGVDLELQDLCKID